MASMMRRQRKATSIVASTISMLRDAGSKDAGLVRAALLSTLPVALISLFCAGTVNAQMDDIDRARRMHDRLAGVPPDDTTLATMATDIGNGRADLADELAMQHPAFYNVSLKNFLTPWTN